MLAALSLVLGYLVVSIARGRSPAAPDGRGRAQEVLTGLVGSTGPVVYRTERAADVVGAVLLGLGLMTALDHDLPRPALRPSRGRC